MPLDARKTQHILQAIGRSFAGRQRGVVIVYRGSGGYSYVLTQLVMRPVAAIDPQVLAASGQPLPRTVDTLLIAPLGTNFTGAVYIADTITATASAVSLAPKYEIVEVLPVGLVPGGSHLRVSLRRLR